MVRKLIIGMMAMATGLSVAVFVSADDAPETVRKPWSERWNQFKQNLSGQPANDSVKTAPPVTAQTRSSDPKRRPMPEAPAYQPAPPKPSSAPQAVGSTAGSQPSGVVTSSRRRVPTQLSEQDASPTNAVDNQTLPMLRETAPGTSYATGDSNSTPDGSVGSSSRRSTQSLQNRIRDAQESPSTDEEFLEVRRRPFARPTPDTPGSAATSVLSNAPTAPIVADPKPAPVAKPETIESPETIVAPSAGAPRHSVLVNRGDNSPAPGAIAEPSKGTTPLPWVSPETTKSPSNFPSVNPAAPPTSLNRGQAGIPSVTPNPMTPTPAAPGTLRREPLNSRSSNDFGKKPNLNMAISGPTEMAYGQTSIYRLSVTNSGTAEADNVVIYLLPMDQKDPGASNSFGKLAAGEMKSVELELAAKQLGTVTIRAQAVASGDNRAEARHDVKIAHPTAMPVQVQIRGPASQVTGSVATYTITLTNTGTVPVNNAKISATLPNGAKMIGATGDAQMNPDESKIEWAPTTLRAGAETVFEVKCRLSSAGQNRVTANVVAGQTKVSGEAKTMVEGLADLKIELLDPVGPVAVGEEATYEIRLRNRGTKAADKITIDGLFSRGVEPIAARGLKSEIKDGAVHFEELPSLAAGKEISLTIRAVADRPGAHLFRLEAQCQSLEAKYAQETTTRFQGEAPAAALEARSTSRRALSSEEPTPAIQK